VTRAITPSLEEDGRIQDEQLQEMLEQGQELPSTWEWGQRYVRE